MCRGVKCFMGKKKLTYSSSSSSSFSLLVWALATPFWLQQAFLSLRLQASLFRNFPAAQPPLSHDLSLHLCNVSGGWAGVHACDLEATLRTRHKTGRRRPIGCFGSLNFSHFPWRRHVSPPSSFRTGCVRLCQVFRFSFLFSRHGLPTSELF